MDSFPAANQMPVLSQKTVDCIGVYIMLPCLLLLVIAIVFVVCLVIKCTE